MDIAHHAAIGVAGMLTLQAAGEEAAGVAFVSGCVAPDLDVAFMALGKRFYLRHHQEISHSVLLAPIYAIGGAALLSLALGWNGSIFVAALAGLWLHSALDLTNTFGIAVFAPLSKRRSSLDAVFFIDGVAWILTLGAIASLSRWKHAWIGALYLAVLALYLGIRYRQHLHVMRKLGCLYAIPSSWHPFEYFTFSENGEYRMSVFNAITGHERNVTKIVPADSKIEAWANRSQVFRDMQHVARALRITEVRTDATGVTIVACDLAVRNFGGRFARTELRFDLEGNLLHETAAI